MGTSLLLQAEGRDDVTAETALTAVAHLRQQQGLPPRLTVDRAPRVVGSHPGRDFPSPCLRFLTCLGDEVTGCPPHRPDTNACVERSHRPDDRECLKISRPTTLGQARDVTAPFVQPDTDERPTQARSCGTRPPRAAFPDLPVLPPVPQQGDPDQWVQTVPGRRSVRTGKHDGTVLVAEDRYYITQALAGQDVALQVDATARAVVVSHRQQASTQVGIKGLDGEPLAFAEYLALLRQAARSQWRPWRRSGRDATTAA